MRLLLEDSEDLTVHRARTFPMGYRIRASIVEQNERGL
jgi:hypothetical protein